MYLDFFTIVVAAVVFYVIGFLWYSSFLFGKQWMKASKHKAGQIKDPKIYIAGFIINFVQAYFLALLFSYLKVVSVADGLVVAFGIWLGFIATIKFSSALWMKTSMQLFFIDVGYNLVGFLAMGSILGA